jgi:hypothetical protein
LGLPRIDQPGNLPVFGNIFVYEFSFLRILPVDLFMAINALGQCGDSGIRAVFPEKMAAFTAIFDLFIVQGMVEVNGLLFLGQPTMRLAINPRMKNRIIGPPAPPSTPWPDSSVLEEGVIGSLSAASAETSLAFSSVLMETPFNSS